MIWFETLVELLQYKKIKLSILILDKIPISWNKFQYNKKENPIKYSFNLKAQY